jgi:hypothetical protein
MLRRARFFSSLSSPLASAGSMPLWYLPCTCPRQFLDNPSLYFGAIYRNFVMTQSPQARPTQLAALYSGASLSSGICSPGQDPIDSLRHLILRVGSTPINRVYPLLARISIECDPHPAYGRAAF